MEKMSVSKRNEIVREKVAEELQLKEKGFLNFTKAKFVKDFVIDNIGLVTVRLDIVVPKEETTATEYNSEFIEKEQLKAIMEKEKLEKKQEKIRKDQEKRAKIAKAKAEKGEE